MATTQTRPTVKPKRKTATRKKVQRTRSAPQPSPAPAIVDQAAERTTKHDQVLTLLSRRDGATIHDMMEATGWQQHSVRGFLAGTVKKKLGLDLTSTKAEGELRRYRIKTKRGR